MIVYSSSNKTIHLWGVGAIADYWMYSTFALILPIFTTGFGLSPILVGWALMMPRLLDAIADPIIGHLSDDTHTRWGRRRPFLFVTAITGAFLIMALWWLPRNWSPDFQFAYLVVVSILLFLSWGTYSMNHLAFGYELSDDYNVRTKVMAVRGLYFSLAAFGGGWTYRLAQLKYFGGEVNGIRCISVVLAAMTLIAAFITISSCQERFKNANRQHVNLFRAIWATMQVRAYVLLIGLRIVQTLGGSLYGAVAFYITAYSVCQNDKPLAASLSGWAGMAGLVVSILMVPLAVKLSRWMGKRLGIIVGYGSAFLAALVLPLFALPGHPYLLLTHMILFSAVAGVILATFSAAVMPDICDIDELKSGERREGLFSAVNSFISKLENSVCILLGGYLVSFSGFDTHKASQLIQQAPEVIQKLRWLGFAPGILFSGIAFVISLYFPLTEKFMENIRAQLDERRKAGTAP